MRSLAWLCVLFAASVFAAGCQDAGTGTDSGYPQGAGDSPTDMEVDVTETDDVITPDSSEPAALDMNEPMVTEPSSDSLDSQPAPIEPATTEPAPLDSTPIEPAPAEPAPVEPAAPEAAPAEPAPIEAAPVEPAPVEAAPTEPAPAPAADDQPLPAPAAPEAPAES